MEEFKIRRATLSEIDLLQRIAKETFYETFSSVNTKENMNKYLEESLSLEKLTVELENKNSEFYFATHDNDLIGYLKVNFGESQTEIKDESSLEIERIYILKEFQGRKVGQLLYEKAKSIALVRKVRYIWLGVWEENPRAIAFYKKNGFVEFDRHLFRLGDDEQTDIMMKLVLTENN